MRHGDWTDNVKGNNELRSNRPDGAHPNSIMSKASAEDMRKIKKGRAKANADVRAMGLWARDGFSTLGGFNVDGVEKAPLYEPWDKAQEDEDV
jgi:hypothetical protein